MQQYRQGDVMLVKVDRLPKGEDVTAKDGKNIVAWGEATGHYHAVRGPQVTMFRPDDMSGGVVFALKIDGDGARLVHEKADGPTTDHGTIELPPGLYEARRQREFTADDVRYVND